MEESVCMGEGAGILYLKVITGHRYDISDVKRKAWH